MLALARNKFVTRLPLPLRLQLKRLQATHAFCVKRYLGAWGVGLMLQGIEKQGN